MRLLRPLRPMSEHVYYHEDRTHLSLENNPTKYFLTGAETGMYCPPEQKGA